MRESKIVIVGAGPVALATLAFVVGQGHKCVLYNRSLARVQGIIDRGGLEVHGDSQQFIPRPRIEIDPAVAFHNADIILIALPAYAQVPAFELCAQHVEDEVAIVFLSGSAATLQAANTQTYRGMSNRVVLAEMAVPPSSARMLSPHAIRVLPHRSIRIASFPANRSQDLMEHISSVLDVVLTPHVLDPAINNPNILIHPAPMLTNFGHVERTDGNFSLIGEGMTDGTLRLMDAIDREKMALQAELELDVFDVDTYYRSMGSDPKVYRQPGENFGSSYRDRIWARYLDEDVPFGTVLISRLGRLIGVPTPVTDAVNLSLSTAAGVDFMSRGRSLQELGISGLNTQQLLVRLRGD